jgi:hypothetical protein
MRKSSDSGSNVTDDINSWLKMCQPESSLISELITISDSPLK